MRFDARAVLRDAWAMWRADSDLLLRVSAAFLFLPQFAILLLLPSMPPIAVTPEMTQAERMALAEKIMNWVSAYGWWYLLGAVLVQAGTLILLMLYLRRIDLREAIGQTVQLFPRYLLAMILVGLPLGLGVLTIVLLLPGLYLLGRLIAVGPALVAEAPMSVRRSLSRAWALSRGHGFVLAGLVSLTIVGGALLAMPFTLIDKALRTSAPNVVAIAMTDAAAAAVTAAALLVTSLIQIAAYRRLVASKGI